MAVDVLLVKEKRGLVAAEPMSAESIDNIKLGEIVTASIRRPRNPAHHRKLFALLKVVHENQTHFATVQDLLRELKFAIGLFECGKTIDGYPWMEARSIAFASMCQAEFEEVYNKMVDVIVTRILPSVNRDELNDRVNDILAGYQPEKRGVA